MKIITKQLNFKTKGAVDLIDITAQVQKNLEESGLQEGNVTVFVIGSTKLQGKLFILLAMFAVLLSGQEADAMRISSPEFEHNGFIPKKFTCDGQDTSPRLNIEDIPADAKSLALIVDDPDAPRGDWVHWLVYNIAPVSFIDEKSAPGKQLKNDSGDRKYGGPCPPSGTHRYFFKIYALDTLLDLQQDSGKQDLLAAMQGHIIDSAELIGLYKR